MADAIFSVAMIFCLVAGVFCIGCAFSHWFAALMRTGDMATRTRRGRHYQGDTDHEGNNGPDWR